MDKIDIDGTGLNNVNWLQNGEEADETILNRPTKQVAQFVNDLIDGVYLKTETYSQAEIDAAIAAGGSGSTQDPYVQYSIYETAATVFADGAKGREDATLRDGWYYENDGTDLGTGGLDKINWYFYDGTVVSTQLSDFSAYAVMTFDDISNPPIFGVYTLPTGTNDAIPGFAHSRIAYSVPDVTPVAGVRYLVYFGAEPNVHNELPRIQLTSDGIANVGEQDPSEIVFTVSLGSNSAAASSTVKYLVRNMGVNTPTFKVDYELKIEHITKQEFASEVDTIVTSTSYTKSEVDSSLALKADSADVYLKTETYSQAEVDAQLSTKADSADVYLKTETYSQAEFNAGTKGDILYHDGTKFVKLAAGTTGQVLTVGASGIPEWQ